MADKRNRKLNRAFAGDAEMVARAEQGLDLLQGIQRAPAANGVEAAELEALKMETVRGLARLVHIQPGRRTRRRAKRTVGRMVRRILKNTRETRE